MGSVGGVGSVGCVGSVGRVGRLEITLIFCPPSLPFKVGNATLSDKIRIRVCI